jgi:hypothetical protein
MDESSTVTLPTRGDWTVGITPEVKHRPRRTCAAVPPADMELLQGNR